jgi:DNA-binding LacI/PurR family transcriptional regulator
VSDARQLTEPPQRRPTILDVARRAGVSKSLVSMVIRGDQRVSVKRREAVLRAAAELDYRPNAMARGLVQRRTRIVGVVISDLRNPFFGEVVSGILQRAGELGYRVLFSTGDAGPRIEEPSIGRVSRAVPLVVLHRRTAKVASDSITNDDFKGAEIAVEHCVSLGHSRIAHIDGGAGAGAGERREGYESAMRRFGLTENILIVPGGFTEAPGRRGAQELLRGRPLPTAVFAANDLCAIGALNAFEEAGLSVPTDISLIGYDNTSLAALRHVSLTSIHQPSSDMGRMAVERLFERIDEGRIEPRHEVVSPSIVIRNTTAPPPGRRS